MSTRPYLGINVDPASAEEIRHRGILNEDETLLALFDGMLLDENRRRIGGVSLSDFIALTDRRLITWARGFFNDVIDSFLWQDVDVAKAETWDPWHGRVVLAFRLPAVAPRTRRIAVKGTADERPEGERVMVNTLDYMPADDVSPLSNMIAWTGDQVISKVPSQAIIEAFAEQFPAHDRQAFSPFFSSMTPEPAAPPPPPTPIEEPRRRWWQRKASSASDSASVNSGNLIADYESRRSAQPAGDGTPALPMSNAGQMPIMVNQPSMYEVSRTLRLLLEAPRRLAGGARRAGEMMSGAGELVNGLQDPHVRRNAMLGIYQAAAQQEAENGPLAPVGPVVRAVVRFSEPLPNEDGGQAQVQAQSRRLQVRAAVRRDPPVYAGAAASADLAPEPTAPAVRRAPPVYAEAAASADLAPKPTAPATTGSVRRSISVRRAEPEPIAEVEEAAPVLRQVPVVSRRITPNRDNANLAPQQHPVPAGVSEEE
ncbi:hypothetical protein EKD04_022105 [Chloroflexales bacterium ZM16-3]|nr:hypothetical protein [Chloroflexales bacterium ZM16-3]